MTTVRVIGDDELNRCLANLPYQVSKKIVISSLRSSAQPMKRQAISNAPERKGVTKKSISIREDKSTDKPSIVVSPSKKAWYSRFHEFGTKGFGKRRRSISGLKVNLKTGRYYYTRVTTGYRQKGAVLPAQRFMERAYDATKNVVLGSVKDNLSRILVRYLEKNAPKVYAK